jgi:cell division septum initiation protein DivIVA
MKKFLLAGGWTLLILTMSLSSAHADLESFLKKLQKTFSEKADLSQSDIIDGLKEALQVGSGNAVQAASRINGYYLNPELKIPLPKSIRKFEDLLRSAGFGATLDTFERSMNRAAEKAAPEARALFAEAIKAMTFSDAKSILKGADDAATRYFEDKTSDRLQTLFKPIVQHAMKAVGVTSSYQSISKRINMLPGAGDFVVDLDAYVTQKAVAGLFVRLAQEEAKIRNEPAARVTELLRKVFGR